MDEVLDEDETLVGKAANQTLIDFVSWVKLRFNLKSNKGSQPELSRPMLVSDELE